ncbi:MAG: hypothetical protein ACRDO1_12255, partial [Nocardioidaceae bacterium]
MLRYVDVTRVIRFEGPTAFSPRFVHPPLLRWAPVKDAQRFQVEVADRDRVVWSEWVDAEAVDLSPAWPDVPLGPVDVLVRGCDEVGREVAVRGYRRFWRVPGFDGMDQEPADWAGCVDRSVAHL